MVPYHNGLALAKSPWSWLVLQCSVFNDSVDVWSRQIELCSQIAAKQKLCWIQVSGRVWRSTVREQEFVQFVLRICMISFHCLCENSSPIVLRICYSICGRVIRCSCSCLVSDSIRFHKRPDIIDCCVIGAVVEFPF